MINVKKLFTKAERGTHRAKVKVTMGGKTFYREQMVGKKDIDSKTPLGSTRSKIDLIDKEIKRLTKIQNESPKHSDEWKIMDKKIDKLIDQKTEFFLNPSTTIH